MFNLMKFLRPFRWTIFVIFILLFVQAMSDLSLPNYLSRIVNIGIQQRGIKNAVPEVIRKNVMRKIEMFINDADRALIEKTYLLLDSQRLSGGDYETYLKKYPGLSHEPLYVLNTKDKGEMERLNAIFLSPIMVVSTIEKKGILSFNMDAKISGDVDPFVYLDQLPPEERDALVKTIMERHR
jgi:ATP-binding cassette subfamily B multidrug efflux pump